MDKEIDRRFVVTFPALCEEQEIILLSAMIDFAIWYNIHKKQVHTFLQMNEEDITINVLIDFWFEFVGKSEEIEGYLMNPDTVKNVYSHLNKFFIRIITRKFTTEKQIFCKSAFRTTEQAERLKQIFAQAPKNRKYKKYVDFLIKFKMDPDHISRDFADMTIKSCS